MSCQNLDLACIFIVFCFSTILFNACSSDNTLDNSPAQNSCNISLPSEFMPVIVDESYFFNQSQQGEPDPEDEDFSTYFEVEQVATQANNLAFESSLFILISSIISYAEIGGTDPSFENGTCIWDAITPPPGQTGGLEINVRIEGRSSDDEADWEIYYDGDFPESERLDNFRLLTGTTTTSGETGEWNIYLPSIPNSPALTYTWNVQSDESYELNVTADPDEIGILVIEYMREGANNNLTFDNGSTLSAEANWNVETDSGWIEDDLGRRCYDNFINSECD